MSKIDPVTIYDGKYTFYIDSEDNLLNCDRYGEPWPAFRANGSHLAGCQLALYHEALELKKTIRRLNWVRCNALGCACDSTDCDCRSVKSYGSILCRACLDKGHGGYQTDRVEYP